MNNFGWQPLPGWDPKDPSVLHPGTRVMIRYFNRTKGKVVEWRRPLKPGGKQVYRIRYGPKGRRRHIEVMRDQLVVLPPKATAPAGPAPADPPGPNPPTA